MKVIGLTGGISSGKSLVADYIHAHYHIPIIDADDVARYHYQYMNGGRIFNKIVTYFGNEILDETGDIDRKRLAKIIFSSKEKRDFLNQTTHMAVGLEMLRRLFSFYLSGQKLVLLDAALLFETKLNRYVYKTIVVQLKRLILRDKITEEEAAKKISSQMSQEQKCKLADFVIDNSESKEDTKRQVDEIYKKVFAPILGWSYLYHLRYPLAVVIGGLLLYFNPTIKSKL